MIHGTIQANNFLFKGVINLGIVIFFTIFIGLIVIAYQLGIKSGNITINNLDNKDAGKVNTFQSGLFKKIFWIPSILWILLSFLVIEDILDLLFFIIPVDSFLLLVWLDISIIITRHILFKRNGISSSNNENIVYDEKSISKFKKIRFPLIMSIITFLVGCILAYTSIGLPLNKDLFIILAVSYFPFLLFLIITLLCYYFGDKKQKRFVFKAIAGVLSWLLIYYYFIAIFTICLLESVNPVTNIKYYKHYVGGSELTKVFPKKIPDDVENIEFYYAPGILQGGTNYVLYYIDRNMTPEKFNENYKKQAIWIGHKKEYTEKNGLLSGAFAYTPAYLKNEEDYTIYLVEGECDNSGYCNHGKFLLAAYNEQTNEVIFSAESW